MAGAMANGCGIAAAPWAQTQWQAVVTWQQSGAAEWCARVVWPESGAETLPAGTAPWLWQCGETALPETSA